MCRGQPGGSDRAVGVSTEASGSRAGRPQLRVARRAHAAASHAMDLRTRISRRRRRGIWMIMELISTPEHDSLDSLDSLIDASMTMYPSRMTALRGNPSAVADRELSNPTSSYYGYVVDGSARIET